MTYNYLMLLIKEKKMPDIETEDKMKKDV